jgi:hypothetical protein
MLRQNCLAGAGASIQKSGAFVQLPDEQDRGKGSGGEALDGWRKKCSIRREKKINQQRIFKSPAFIP